jgi:hypothetical protein
MVTDWEREFIHIFNKREKIYKLKSTALKRPNVLLMGDIIEDMAMTDPL